jgi:hypothetical protein
MTKEMTQDEIAERMETVVHIILRNKKDTQTLNAMRDFFDAWKMLH